MKQFLRTCSPYVILCYLRSWTFTFYTSVIRLIFIESQVISLSCVIAVLIVRCYRSFNSSSVIRKYKLTLYVSKRAKSKWTTLWFVSIFALNFCVRSTSNERNFFTVTDYFITIIALCQYFSTSLCFLNYRRYEISVPHLFRYLIIVEIG